MKWLLLAAVISISQFQPESLSQNDFLMTVLTCFWKVEVGILIMKKNADCSFECYPLSVPLRSKTLNWKKNCLSGKNQQENNV